MRITDIGEVREDGSILLYDENIKGRKDLPRRIRPSAVQKQVLAENGLQWVLSSFISAIGEDENDLIIRFQVLFHSPLRGSFRLSLTVLVHYRSVSSI